MDVPDIRVGSWLDRSHGGVIPEGDLERISSLNLGRHRCGGWTFGMNLR